MDRREFLHAGGVVGLATLSGVRPLGWWQNPDLVLRRAVVFDGAGAPGVEADVAILGDRIHAVGRVAETGGVEIDLAGKALAPGFIDIHTHADRPLLDNPRAENSILQGITLEVGGQCGGSPGPLGPEGVREARDRYRERYGVEVDLSTLGGFFDALEAIPPSVNAACMVGHGTIRGLVIGNEDRPATEGELARMRALVAEGLAQGAVGFTSGLEYTPSGFASREELVELAKALHGTGYPYASHMRNEDDGLLAAVEEALHVGRLAGVPVEISHLKAQGERNWWKAEVVLELLERVRAPGRTPGVDVHYDRYPYVAYATGLSNLFPNWSKAGGNRAFVARLQDPEIRPRLEAYAREKVAQLGSWNSVQISSAGGENAWIRGRRMGDAARERGVDPFALAVELLVSGGGSVGMIGFGMGEENTARILSHPLGMVCSDGSVYAPEAGGSPHPRSYGTFPRVLGYYVREQGLMPLETAIHKMTGMAAAKIQLDDRGVVRPGAYADLVAFDPGTVRDRATFDDPKQYPEGIELVMVNGALAVREGAMTGELAGRPVRGRGA